MEKAKERRVRSEMTRLKHMHQIDEDGYYCCHKFKLRKVRDTELIEHVDKLIYSNNAKYKGFFF